MRFRNAFLVLLENFKNTYKILLYKLIVAVVCAALYFALIFPELNAIFSSTEWLALKENFTALAAAFLPTASADQFETLRQQLLEGTLPAFFQMLLGQTTGILVRLTLCALVYLLQRFVDTMCYFAVGSILNDRMRAYSDTPFSRAYLSNLSKSAKYSLLYVPVCFLFDILSIFICLMIFDFVPLLYTPFFCVSVIAVVQAVKFTYTSHWMPAVAVDGMSLRGAMRALLKTDKKQRPKMFATYLAAAFAVISVNVFALICTAGSALLLTVPASYLFLLCLQFVNYYTVTGKKYFITYDNIAKTSSFGDAEEFFKVVEKEEQENLEK